MSSELFISKKIVYSAQNILNPPDTLVLLEKNLPKSAYNLPGEMTFSIGAFDVSNLKAPKITGILATLSQNYSKVRRSYLPATTLHFFSVSERGLHSVLASFSDSDFANSKFKFDGKPVPTLETLRDISFELDFNKSDIVLKNIVTFESYGPNYEFLFAPRHNPVRSIFDKIQKFWSVSFTDYLDSKVQVDIPSQTKYVLIIPDASAPTPISKTQTKSDISLQSLVTLNVSEGL
ncbi:hypothetical protein [Leptospira stimsonii]|uniref:Uncharacterized protein n=1 Tax=Leptospira stimsonii TaxID=2202203 RepID=A0ABY2MV28_9LEPT|nr:hypothetical protein [Leptospira stimsonii]TGK25381.1 hypothetical protein EHO98_02995 [Leptospira stimsonii]TGM08800.1 hypothetical protein EHQ90_22180 [Leptospira stimsonii]